MNVKCPVCYGDGCRFCDHTGEVDSTLCVWGHLQDTPLRKHYFSIGTFSRLWGGYLEKLGRRVLNEDLPNEFYDSLFSDVKIFSSERYGPSSEGRIFRRKKGINVTVDYLVVLHCQNLEGWEKNAVFFEIKSSISPISAKHIAKWTKILSEPEEYVKKCQEKARLFIMWIHGFDPEGRNLFYTLKEFDPSQIPNHFHGDDR